MTTGTAFTLRPLERNPPNTPSNALEGAFRIHLSQKELKNLGLVNGDLVRLSTAAGFKGYAAAWLASQTNPGNKPIAKVTDLLREHYDLALTDPVFVEKVTEPLKPLKAVEVSLLDPEAATRFASDEELLHWIRSALGRISHMVGR
jgi:AAA family ATPase